MRLALGSDQSSPALAADLSVPSEARRRWLRQDDADAGRGQPGALTTGEREELRRLREGDLVRRWRCILGERATYPSAVLRRIRRVARSAYDAQARCGGAARAQADEGLAGRIAAA